MRKINFAILTLVFLLFLFSSCAANDISIFSDEVTEGNTDLNPAALNTKLIQAVEAGDLASVKFLLARGADVNYVPPDDYPTPLLTAIASGNTGMVKQLVKNKANLNFSPEGLPTPLYLAVTLDEYEMVKLLLNKGADPNKQSILMQYNKEYYMSPLYAALFISDDIFRLVLDKSSKRGGKLSDFPSILEYAVRYDDYNKVKLLIDAGASISEDALPIAFDYGSDRKIVDYLLKKGAKISNDFVKYFCDTMKELRFCLDNGVKPEDIIKYNPRVLNYYEKLEFLLDNGLSPNTRVSDENFPGIAVVYDSSSDNVSLIYGKITYDTVPLVTLYNLYRSKFSFTELLLERGADPNAALPGGERAWMYVSLLNDSMVYAAQKAELLKRYGALKDFRPLFEAQGKLDLYEKWKTAHKEYEEGHFIIDESSELPILDTKEKQIIEMVYRNDIDALKRAVADGADFNFADDFGNTPLLAAISKKDTAMARFLLENGADPDDWGFIFPIIGAIKTNCAEIVELLIEKGADLSNKDLRFSPIVGSIILQKPEITNLLRKYEFNLDDALFAAMSVRDVTLMEELLDMGADPNMIKFGVPLIDLNEHIGTVGKNISANYRIFRLLLNKKVSLNVYNNTMLSGLAFDDDGTVSSAKEYPTSILTHILLMGIIKKLKLMLENGADPNIPNIGGETPIMFAAFHINCDYNALMGMNYLINYGADPSIKADKGFSAYDLLGKPSVMKGSKCSLPPNMQKTVKLILDKGKKP